MKMPYIDKSSLIFLGVVILSFIASYIFLQNNPPYIGTTIIFLILSSFIYWLKQPKRFFDTLLYTAIVFFSLMISVRANETVIFFNIVAVLLLGAIMTTQKKEDRDFRSLFLSPFYATNLILISRNVFEFKTNLLSHIKIAKISFFTTRNILSVLITVILLLFVLPILASVNPFFDQFLKTISSYVNIAQLLKVLFGDNVATFIGRLLMTFILSAVTLRLSSYVYSSSHNHEIAEHSSSQNSSVLLLPKIVLSIVLLIFFIAQLQLYTASADTLKALHYSNSRYVNEVFAQLSIVSLIVFLLVYNDKHHRNKLQEIFTYILIIEGFFLCLVGLKSDIDYTVQWGFTFKRLYGYAVVSWIMAALGIFAYMYQKHVKTHLFARSILMVSIATLVVINVANFDYIIYHFNKSITYRGVDYGYLSRLSTDSYSYHEQLDFMLKEKDLKKTSEVYYSLEKVLSKIEYLKNKYSHLDLRSLNLSEYMQYIAVKDIDLNYYESKKMELWNSLQQNPIQEYPDKRRAY
jgi:hypothetical protein